MLASARLASTPALLLLGLAAALAVRIAVSGTAGAASQLGGLLFAAALLALVLAAGPHLPRLSLSTLLLGLVGGAVLVAGPLLIHAQAGALWPALPAGAFLPWALVAASVAVAEELFLRGVLFSVIESAAGAWAAVLVAALAFAALHVPLYGWHVFLLDLTVGIWLGALRVASGGVAAPAVAHVLADLAGWWLI